AARLGPLVVDDRDRREVERAERERVQRLRGDEDARVVGPRGDRPAQRGAGAREAKELRRAPPTRERRAGEEEDELRAGAERDRGAGRGGRAEAGEVRGEQRV